MKQMGKWLVTAVLALLMMIPAVLAEETASFMTLGEISSTLLQAIISTRNWGISARKEISVA